MPTANHLPENWMQFWYLIAKECVAPFLAAAATLVTFFFISQVIDTEWYAVAAAAMGAGAGQWIKKG